MNIIGLVCGPGVKAKRSRRGMEKDWNRFDEPVRKFLKHGDSMKRSRRWVKYKHERETSELY